MNRLTFVSLPLPKGRKTDQFEVWTDGGHGFYLGKVAWYARWRRFCFYPEKYSTFDADCLREIWEKIFSRWRLAKQRRKQVVVANFFVNGVVAQRDKQPYVQLSNEKGMIAQLSMADQTYRDGHPGDVLAYGSRCNDLGIFQAQRIP